MSKHYHKWKQRPQANGDEVTQIWIWKECSENWCKIGSCWPKKEYVCAFCHTNLVIIHQIHYHIWHQSIASHLLKCLICCKNFKIQETHIKPSVKLQDSRNPCCKNVRLIVKMKALWFKWGYIPIINGIVIRPPLFLVERCVWWFTSSTSSLIFKWVLCFSLSLSPTRKSLWDLKSCGISLYILVRALASKGKKKTPQLVFDVYSIVCVLDFIKECC